uniref:Putative ORF3 n=1 Tax=Torque teno calomys tener virus TaxID=2054616 RepID=A0A2H4QBC3_9VIRU|nr:putative ORF3 [Torque teno calomys tener virus]
MYCLLRLILDSGHPTHLQWSQTRGNPANMNLDKKKNSPKKCLPDLQGLWKKLRKSHSAGTLVKHRPKKKRLLFKGKKRRSRSSKRHLESSSSSSEYSTSESTSDSSDSDECNWEDSTPLTPSQDMNWTQFINKLCTAPIVDPSMNSVNTPVKQ